MYDCYWCILQLTVYTIYCIIYTIIIYYIPCTIDNYLNNLYEAPSVLCISVYQKTPFSITALGSSSTDTHLGDIHIPLDELNHATNHHPMVNNTLSSGYTIPVPMPEMPAAHSFTKPGGVAGSNNTTTSTTSSIGTTTSTSNTRHGRSNSVNNVVSDWYPLEQGSGGGAHSTGKRGSVSSSKQSNEVWLLYLQTHINYVLLSAIE